MYVLHIALQGCLRAGTVDYGITADTGGHIRYLLDLVNACVLSGEARRIVMATRAFEGAPGPGYEAGEERVSDAVSILRLRTDDPAYLPKEELWRETPRFADALVRWIEGQDERPDMIHAHYADAGTVAATVEERLGIPFVFTAHSLGRVKRAVMGGGDDALDRRIAIEEAALGRASLVVASSRDEAEVQYADYGSYDPGRIRVIPPGSDLDGFDGALGSRRLEQEIGRFLIDPAKPVILALARPVAKKNLPALVRAFGESAELRARANLVVMAGNRAGLETLDAEMRGQVEEMLRLVDRYDLYGHVAYPKTHRPEEVAAIYAYARQRRGLFVNPALNEPFGLTLLEASAAGLPLVATDSGGPNDIIEMCRNGELVDPRDPAAIAKACLAILRDPALWDRYAAAGARAVAAYDWTRHARRYGELLRSLKAPPKAPQAPAERPTQLLVCDIDNTLVGCEDGIRSFNGWRQEQEGLAFGVATGRSFHSAMAILEQQEAPRPQVMITSVGSEIYHLGPNGTTYGADRSWEALVSRGWERERVAETLEDMPGIRPQAALEQRRHKLSYFSDGDPETAARVHARLERAGLRCSVIHSHGRYLDILPLRASKGTAVNWVRRLYGLGREAVFVAGDSGNDIEMLRAIPQAIIVGNFSDGLPELPGLGHTYVARATHARGIIEGVAHFRAKALPSGKALVSWPSPY
ncbi:HAD-IIB family hydrolase [Aureimonas sp. AU4]|uniref:HAD-IIB family hydrolase n=1 Tax=Aureimonas sp. AU4 TaxID=1638163 RepID=UPI000785D7EB|nr:HAD-IIB family hydrolase [Aureimonas sp. AU4]